MKKRTKIVLSILGGLLLSGAIFCAIAVWIIGGLTDAILSPPLKPPVGIVGADMNQDAKACHDFICQATGLAFPDGTQVDAYDTGYNLIVACFTLPTNTVDAFLTDNNAVVSLFEDSVVLPALTNLTAHNQSILSTISSVALQNTNTWEYPLNMYYDGSSRRLWVQCHYRGWFD